MFQYAQQDAELNQMILSGQNMEAFERFYADDVVMQENNGEPTVGKAANRERELGVFAFVERFNEGRLLRSAGDGDTSFSEWSFDYVLKNGVHIRSTQIARRIWRDGKVVDERFFYGT